MLGDVSYILRLIPDFVTGIFPLLEAWDKERLQDSHPEELKPY